MKAIASYVSNEWKYWVLALLLTIGMGVMANTEARPVMKYNANGMEFHQDIEKNTWYARYENNVTNLGESFDDIRIIWKSKYAGTPVVLIAGQQGPMCEMTLRLYWYRTPIDLAVSKAFNTCFAQKFDVSIKGNIVTVKYDDKVQTIELK